MIDRRTALSLIGATGAAATIPVMARAAGVKDNSDSRIGWTVTTQTRRWQKGDDLALVPFDGNPFGRAFEMGAPAQMIEGFGAAFSELGWRALRSLPDTQLHLALEAVFGDDGAGLNLGRTPIGANDFGLKWYSYDETPGDFALDHFSVANDRTSLMPFIKAAQAIRPELRIWASPWSPPTWMKTNGHYAMSAPWPGMPANGIRHDQLVREGQDAFIQDDRHFDAYARYFRRYVEAYGREGIRIGMVMPQNEFNSAQPFPSCTWTPEGLARFIPHLGREMNKIGTDVFFGTLERGDVRLLDTVMTDPTAAAVVKGVGVQWAGKGALKDIRAHYPNLPIWGTEQECGDGRNDWHYARYGWGLIKEYFNAGASGWNYWNMALPSSNPRSTWGWPQNSLIQVDVGANGDDAGFKMTNDYWVLRHLSAYVRRGARFVPTSSMDGYTNQLVFRNPDGELIIVLHNDLADPLRLTVPIGMRQLNLVLPPDSFNTISIPTALSGT